MKSTHLLITFVIVAAIGIGAVSAQEPPFRLRQSYLTNVGSNPTFITNAKDGSRRLFLVEQAGIIKVVQPGSTAATDFMNITARILSGGERGLLGLAFHPNFKDNHYFFVNYTRQTDGATIVSRFTAINNNTAGDPNSERIVLGPIAQPFSNHNGGMIEFRQDSPGVYNLYVGMGDGGSSNDPGNRAQNVNELLGKFLRVTPDVSGNNANPAYTVPADNPYVGVTGADEIYAIGVRNPWRWSFDRGGTNQLWAGDVGQGTWEEVDIITRGANYGWSPCEGLHVRGSTTTLCTDPAFTPPVLEYSSITGSPCNSLTGGYVYRGAQKALTNGRYIYADYCTGEIWVWNGSQQVLLLDSTRNITSFGEDEDGELYLVHANISTGAGAVDKLMGNRISADFDGDLKSDRAVYRPSTNTYYTLNSSNGNFVITPFGLPGDIATPEDYDGDGKVDVSVFRPANSTWYYIRSTDGAFIVEQFGQTGDTPVTGDFDADGKSDLTVFRGSTGEWVSRRSKDQTVITQAWGLAGDTPVAGDYDGDNRLDLTVWRPSNGNWYTINSTTGNIVVTGWGLTNDIPSQGDFDADGRADLTVFRPSTGEWFIRKSSNNSIQVQAWGLNGDIPVVGDYDGDTVDDMAVFRPSNGIWYVIGSASGVNISQQWGLNGDSPVPRLDTP